MSGRPGDVETFRAAALTARQAHVAIAIDADLFAPHLAAVAAAGERPLTTLCVDDLYVAFACCRGDPAAIGELERLLAPVRALMVRRGNDAALVDDALQAVRYRLLVATPQREAKLATYRGTGSLGGWLRIVALRQLYATRAAPDGVQLDSGPLARLAITVDATLAVVVRTHGPAVRRMFRDALASLDDRQRDLLRLEILDGLRHQQIAELHGVHRTTVVRWIDEARQLLALDVRRRIKRELGLGDDSAESLLRAMAGHIELSLGSGLLPA
jgi:RNA polymerase sigma-70 factor (ECF subfamily)